MLWRVQVCNLNHAFYTVDYAITHTERYQIPYREAEIVRHIYQFRFSLRLPLLTRIFEVAN